MLIIPAIDLKDGKAVRLTKGEMASYKVYGEPLNFAHQFEAMGAKWLHIVDLNGAFVGEPRNLHIIKLIRESCKLNIELGGGIRDEDSIKRYIDMGIDRVILGSIAIKDSDFVLKMAQKYRIAVGIDAKNGKVSTDGWANTSEVSAGELAARFKGSKIEALICTDIMRDGMLSGINVSFSEMIARKSGIPTIASGGFSSQGDLEVLLKSNGISGVIVGKAFYEGRVNLKEIFKKYRN